MDMNGGRNAYYFAAKYLQFLVFTSNYCNWMSLSVFPFDNSQLVLERERGRKGKKTDADVSRITNPINT